MLLFYTAAGARLQDLFVSSFEISAPTRTEIASPLGGVATPAYSIGSAGGSRRYSFTVIAFTFAAADALLARLTGRAALRIIDHTNGFNVAFMPTGEASARAIPTGRRAFFEVTFEGVAT